MIKRALLILLCLLFVTLNVNAFTIAYDGKTEEYSGREISLFVNGEMVETDMPAIIMNSRTLVPARAVFEKLGAEVLWDEVERQVDVIFEETNVQLTIDSDVAYINDVKNMIDSPAKIINDRTMIPVRFPAEAIGCEVLWNDEESSVRIDFPDKFLMVNDIVSVYEDGFVTTTVTFDEGEVKTEDFTLADNRIVVDIEGLKLEGHTPRESFDGISVKTVRAGQFSFEPYVLRLVADVESITEYDVLIKENSVVFKVKAIEVEDEPLPEIPENPLSWADGIALSEDALGKLVLVDAGHGGVDVGAIGDRDGENELYEKDVNLAVSLYLQEYLTEAGVEVEMTREEDVAVELYDRPEIANDLDATLVVSVHSNSFATELPHGTTVMYYAKADETTSDGKRLAKNIQKELVAALGTFDRGLMDGSEMIVIKNTAMPAVIVEMAFISNPSDREILADDDCRKLAAQAIARGVIKTLNEISKTDTEQQMQQQEQETQPHFRTL